MIQLVASAFARKFIPYNLPLDSFEATYAEPMPRLRLKALNRGATTIAERPSSKKLAVVLRLPASQQASRGLSKLYGMGLYKIPLTAYSTALSVVERAAMRSAVQQLRLACRSVLLHKGPASLSSDGSGGKARVERRSWFTIKFVA